MRVNCRNVDCLIVVCFRKFFHISNLLLFLKHIVHRHVAVVNPKSVSLWFNNQPYILPQQECVTGCHKEIKFLP